MVDARDIDALAADWIARCDRGLDGEERGAFDAWLDADIAHRVAWLRLDAAWRKADRLATKETLSRPVWARRLGRLSRSPATKKPLAEHPVHWRLAASVVLSLALASGLVVHTLQTKGEEMSTAVGGRAVAPLADGSRIELNTDTSLRVAVRADRREVWLHKGEAYFDIAPDPAHPFVIHADKRRVTVLGTRFTVRRDGDRIEVTVAEGRVRVDQPGSRTSTPRIATVGDRLVAQGPSTRVDHLGGQAIADHMGWRQGRIAFQDATLAEVAAEMNRYNQTQIVVTDAVAGDVRIGGAFDPLNVTAFAVLMGEAYGLQISKNNDIIYISAPDTGIS